MGETTSGRKRVAITRQLRAHQSIGPIHTRTTRQLPAAPVLVVAAVLLTASCRDANVQALLDKPQPGAPWVLRARARNLATYVDSSRIETKVENYPLGVWVRYDWDPPVHLMGPAHRYGRADMRFYLDCPGARARLSYMTLYDSTGATHSRDISTQEIPGGHFTDAMYSGYAVLLRSICQWLRNPATPPILNDITVGRDMR